jgi:hypothetical protein
MENNNTQNKPTTPTPDYSNLSEKEQMDLAMKQAGITKGDLVKNAATNMAKSTATSWLKRLLRSFFKF